MILRNVQEVLSRGDGKKTHSSSICRRPGRSCSRPCSIARRRSPCSLLDLQPVDTRAGEYISGCDEQPSNPSTAQGNEALQYTFAAVGQHLPERCFHNCKSTLMDDRPWPANGVILSSGCHERIDLVPRIS